MGLKKLCCTGHDSHTADCAWVSLYEERDTLRAEVSSLKADLAEAQRGNWEVETAQALDIAKLKRELEASRAENLALKAHYAELVAAARDYMTGEATEAKYTAVLAALAKLAAAQGEGGGE